MKTSFQKLFGVNGKPGSAKENSTELENVQIRLRHSETHLHSIFENSAIGFILMDTKGDILEINDITSHYTMLAFDKPLKKKDNLIDSLPEYRRKDVKMYFGRVLKGEKVQYESIYPRGNGISVWFNINIHPVVNPAGKIDGLCLSLENISERKNAEEKLKQSEIRFHTAVENAAIGMCLMSPDGKLLKVNRALCKLLDYTEQELLNKTFATITHPDDIFISQRQILRAIEEKQDNFNFEKRYLKKKGEIVWAMVSSSLLRDDDQKPLYFFTQIIDITNRKSTEEKLHQLSQAVEQSPVTIVITDTKGNIEYVNQKFVDLTGYTATEAFGKNPRILKSGHTPEEAYRDLWQKITSGNEWRGELYNKKKNGELYCESATISPIMNPKGEITSFVAVKEDITEKNRVQKLLEDSQKNLQQVLASHPDIFYVVDRDLNITLINESAKEILGKAWGKPVLPGNNLTDLIPPGKSEPILESFQKVFKGESIEYEIHEDLPEWFLVSCSPVFDSNKNITGAYVITKNITARKITEQELKKTKKQFQDIVENISGVYWINNASTKETLYISPSYEKIWGRKCEDLYNNSADFIKAVYPDDRSDVYEAYINSEKTKQIDISYRIIKPCGEIRWIHSKVNVVTDSEGNTIEYGYADDITERKNTEEQIKESELKYKDLVENISDLICTHDLDGRILSMNKAAEKTLGLRFDPGVNFNIKDILTPGTRKKYDSYIDRIKKEGHIKDYMKVQLANGETRIWEFNNSLKISETNVPIVRGYARDITEQKKQKKK